VLALRKAETPDVAAIQALARAAYGRYIDRIGRPPAPVSADYAAAVTRGEVWVATDGADVVGLLVLVAKADHLLLENVAVLPSAQGTGIGARLLALAEEQAMTLGLAEIRLYTHVTMSENIAYYPKHGYVATHRGNDDGFDRVNFTKRLPGH